jgi:uncharacterized protein
MKLFLVGATGRTGKWILKAALAGGHQVTALVRDPTDRLGISHPSLSVVSGDLFTVQNLIAAAETAGVKRFFGFAGGGILQLDENRLRRDRPGYPEIFLKSSARHLQAWKALEASSLNWTLICTPDIANTAATGQAKFRADYMPTGGNSVAAGDIAEFLLTELDAGLFSRKRVGFTI